MRSPMTLSLPSLFALGSAIALLSGLAAGSQDAQVPLSSSFVCKHPPYKVHLVSKSPLIMYITDFLTPEERSHLQTQTENTFSQSGVQGASSGSKAYHQARTSQSTNIPRDAVVRCIEDRALLFQGFDVPRSHLEPLQLVRYGRGQHFHFHTDWFPDPAHARADAGGNRLSSFFAYVHVANGTTGGGTNFPLVDAPADDRWCRLGYVDCDEPWENGVTFRPTEGNAVFWQNLHPNGAGDDRTLHAGLPVSTGGKIGMNIWTRQAPLSEEIRGPDIDD